MNSLPCGFGENKVWRKKDQLFPMKAAIIMQICCHIVAPDKGQGHFLLLSQCSGDMS